MAIGHISWFQRALLGRKATTARFASFYDNRVPQILDGLMYAQDLALGAPHARPDATNNSIDPVITGASDQADTNTFCHALKDKYNAHIALVNPVHIAADVTNAISAADPDDLAKCKTVLNEFKADFNAHKDLAGATGHFQADAQVDDIAFTDLVGGDSLATTITAALECYEQYVAHCAAHYLLDSTDILTYATKPAG